MSDLDVVCHAAEDGSVYAVKVVPPERDDYEAQYGVIWFGLTDRYGLEHEQRLRLGAYFVGSPKNISGKLKPRWKKMG
jgi:hypothetical protein